MSSRDHRVTLRHIEEYALRAQEICSGKTLDILIADWQATLALERALEILGEATKRLPDDLRQHYPQVEWKAVAGMRDRLIHGYDSIDYGILWKTVHERLPALLTTVEQMLRDLDGDPRFRLIPRRSIQVKRRIARAPGCISMILFKVSIIRTRIDTFV